MSAMGFSHWRTGGSYARFKQKFMIVSARPRKPGEARNSSFLLISSPQCGPLVFSKGFGDWEGRNSIFFEIRFGLLFVKRLRLLLSWGLPFCVFRGGTFIIFKLYICVRYNILQTNHVDNVMSLFILVYVYDCCV